MQILTPFAVKRRGLLTRFLAMLLPMVCLMVLLSQTVLAQNTYMITDGDQTVYHTSFASDPEKVLDEAGFRLEMGDFYTTQAEDGIYDITVQRAVNVTVNNCGHEMMVISYGETVEALLSRLGIPAEGEYRVDLPLDTRLDRDMTVTVTRLMQVEQTYTVDVPFTVRYEEDPTMPEDEERILVKGEAGQVLRTANVTYHNADEVSRTVVEEKVLTEPQEQVVARGTGEAVGQSEGKPIIGDGYIILPSGEKLTYYKKSTFKASAYTHMDAGCDMTTATGSKVRWGVVAVDPKVIPYGTRMFIVNKGGGYVYGLATAEDCGGAIQGKRIDLYMPTLREAFAFGRQDCTVYFLGDANWRF